MTSHSTAHYFLEGLADLGIEYLFSNLGTDHVSLIEELACCRARKSTGFIMCHAFPSLVSRQIVISIAV